MTETHTWHISNHARPTFCNVCRESLSGIHIQTYYADMELLARPKVFSSEKKVFLCFLGNQKFFLAAQTEFANFKGAVNLKLGSRACSLLHEGQL